jgi:FKBP-type peptidyl-prolyl isomerase-like protein
MADERKAEAGPDRQKLLTVLVPAGGLALIIVLVAVVLAMSESSTHPSDKGKGGGDGSSQTRYTEGAGKPMSDGSNGGTDDPGLKDIGHGLKVRDLKEGTGPEVKPGATIRVKYTGWLTNGSVFDSGETEFPLGRVIQGWQKGIPGMKVGGIRKLVIPAALGYGSGGSGDKIPPNATLIFEVEVLGVK